MANKQTIESREDELRHLAEIARAAWMAADFPADYWIATAIAVRDAVIEECIRKVSQELTFAGPADALSAVEDYRELLLDDLRALKSPAKGGDEARKPGTKVLAGGAPE